MFCRHQLQRWNQSISLHRINLGSLETKVCPQTCFHFLIIWAIGIIWKMWIHSSLQIMLSGILPNLQYKIIIHGIPEHSHNTNLLCGLLDGGISIQGTSFLNKLHHNSRRTFLNTLLRSRSCSCRTIFSLMHLYDLSFLPNLILTRIIKQSINWRLSTCRPTPFPLYLATIFIYVQGK